MQPHFIALDCKTVVLLWTADACGAVDDTRAEMMCGVTEQVPVTLYRKVVPTPLVPWCVEEQRCAAGVMVTASHNPKEDNGGKARFFPKNCLTETMLRSTA